MKWPRKNQHLDEALTEQRDDMSLRLNIMRPNYDSPEVEHAEELIRKMLPEMSDELKYQGGQGFGSNNKPIRILKGNSPRRGQADFKNTFVMSIYVATFTEGGLLRRDPKTGQPIGKKWFNSLLKQHAFNDKGGTARSNLMYWHLANFERSTKDQRSVEEKRKAFKAVRHELFRGFQKHGQ